MEQVTLSAEVVAKLKYLTIDLPQGATTEQRIIVITQVLDMLIEELRECAKCKSPEIRVIAAAMLVQIDISAANECAGDL